MGVTRVSDLAENRFIRIIRDIEDVGANQKGSAQRVSGANLAYVASDSGLDYDWKGSLSTASLSPGFGYASFVVTLTSKTAVVPLSDIAVTMFYSTDGGVTYSEYTKARGMMEGQTGTTPQTTYNFFTLYGVDVPEYTSKFALSLYGILDSRFALKIQAFSTDEVTVNVARVA